jgi:hypothetical protein
MPTHSTPSGVVVEYFDSLRWLTQAAQAASDPKHARRLAAMSTILAVTAVEVFLNLWFRIRAAELNSEELQKAIVQDLEAKISLDQKLSRWPKTHLHAKLNVKSGPGGAFVSLKTRRNSIIHFESTHETIHASNIIIHGLADTTEYDALTAVSAVEALATAEGFIAEVFRLAGFDEAKTETALAGWTGRRGSHPSVEATSPGVPSWLAPHVQS